MGTDSAWLRALGLVAAAGVIVSLNAPGAAAHTRAERCVEAALLDRKPSGDSWTEAESFVWAEACARRTADLSRFPDWFGVSLADERRQLRGRFLHEILTEEPFDRWLDGHPLRIRGAWLHDGLRVSGADLASGIEIESSMIEGRVDMRGTRIPGPLTLDGVIGLSSPALVDLTEAEIEGTVSIFSPIVGVGRDMSDTGAAVVWEVRLDRAVVAHDVVTAGQFGEVSAAAASIGGTFDAAHASYDEVDLQRARVAGALHFDGAAVTGLRADEVVVGAGFSASGGVVGSQGLSLAGANLGQGVVLTDARVVGRLNLAGADVRGHVLLHRAAFGGTVDLSGMHVGGDVRAECGVADDGLDEALRSGLSPRQTNRHLRPRPTIAIPVSPAPDQPADCRFGGEVRMDGADIGGALSVVHTTFGDGVVLKGVRVGADLAMLSVAIERDVALQHATVGGDLMLLGQARSVELAAAHVGGDVEICCGLVEGLLQRAEIRGSVVMHDLEVAAGLDLFEASIAENLVLERGAFELGVRLTNAEIGLELRAGGATFDAAGFDGGALLLDGARIGRRLDLARVTITNSRAVDEPAEGLTIIGATIGGGVDLRRAQIETRAAIERTTIGGDVDLAGARFQNDLSLKESDVGGVLRLHDLQLGSVQWESGVFDLRATHVGGIVESLDATLALEVWPPLRLSGFTYGAGGAARVEKGEVSVEPERLAADTGFVASAEPIEPEGFFDHDLDWYEDWLGRDAVFSRHPYLVLEKSLRDGGRSNAADNIAMARLDEELDQPGVELYERGLGWLHFATVGYGYKPEWSAFWLVGLFAVGWAVAGALKVRLDRQPPVAKRITSPFLFSLDRMVLVGQFGSSGGEHGVTVADMPIGYKVYFVGHSIAAYLLAFALVAAITGVVGG